MSCRPVSIRAAAAAATLLTALVWTVLAPAAARATIVTGNASTGTNVLGSSLVINEPSGVSAGQLLLADVVANGTGAVTPPSGWTAVQSTVTGQRQVTYYHVTTSSEPASWTWTLGSVRVASGGIIAYSGVNPTTPIDASAQSSGSGTGIVAPSVTTNNSGDRVVAAVSAASTVANSVTPAASMTERYDVSTVATESEAAGLTQAAAGATGTFTATAAVSAPWIAHTIALNDASNAGLSVATGATPSFAASLPAGDQTQSYALPLTVQDTRTGTGSGSGWNLTITSTRLTSGSHTLPSGASRVTGVTSACAGGAVCVAPTSSLSYPLSVPAGAGPPSGAKMFNAAAATGTGAFTITPTISVAVPANAYAGTYQSTVTVAIVSGP